MKKRNRFWNYSSLVLGVLFLLTNSCKKEKDPTTVADIDGNIYHFVTLGTQVWMVENLNVTHYRNGDTISNYINSYDWNNTLTGAYRNYDNDPANGKNYGKLYNFFSVTDTRNLCPPGWHVPSDAEWRILREYLGGFNTGGSLKETGTAHWLNPNLGATNSSGFAALPGGSYFAFPGKFAGIEVAGYRKPNFNIIIGKSAFIQHDIIDQMSEAGSLYNINFIQTNISSVSEMVSAIQASNNPDIDILVIARGGGDIENETINKPELAEACLDLKPFLVTALGHKVNTPLLECIADKKFFTPTAFG